MPRTGWLAPPTLYIGGKATRFKGANQAAGLAMWAATGIGRFQTFVVPGWSKGLEEDCLSSPVADGLHRL